jgi:GDP-L-fucose synthase
MVGAALVRRLRAESCTILTVDHATLDLTRQAETERWIGTAKPDVVILAAAKVGGIAFNDTYPVDFLSDNLTIALNVIGASYAAGVKKLLFLGSSCIYPKLAPQPMDEGVLLTGPPGANQSMVRGGQDRRHQTGRGLWQAHHAPGGLRAIRCCDLGRVAQ